MISLPFKYPALFKCYSKTLQDVLDEYIKNRHLRFFFSAMIFMLLGLPPSRLSALMGLSFFYFAHYEGLFYPQGGAHRIPQVLSSVVERYGGRIRLNTRVEKIIVERRGVKAVKTTDGEEISTQIVISNVDARQTFWHFVGRDKLPSWLNRKLEKFKPSISFNQLWLCLNSSLDKFALDSSEAIIFHSEDMESVYKECYKKHFVQSGAVAIPTLLDPQLAPQGCSIICIISPTGSPVPEYGGGYQGYKDRLARHLTGIAERILPGVSEYIVDREVATPLTFERYTSNSGGAAYGWASTPEQSTLNGILPCTPIKGLYLAGHWTYPCGGTIAAMISGKCTATLVESKFQGKKRE